MQTLQVMIRYQNIVSTSCTSATFYLNNEHWSRFQQQRDNLCRLIAEEREAMSRTRAKLNFKQQQHKLAQKAAATVC